MGITVGAGPPQARSGAAGPRPGDVIHVPVEALAELGVPVEPEQAAAVTAAGRWPWADAAVAADRAASVRLIVAVLAGAWSPRRRGRAGEDLRPTARQAQLGRRLVRAAGEHAAGLVAHACARVMPAELGALVPDVHSSAVCLGLYQAWCRRPACETVTPPSVHFLQAQQVLGAHVAANAAAEHRPAPGLDTAARRAEQAELVAWRLGTALRQVRWADGTLRQAEITGALGLFEAWKADLPRPDRLVLADALIELAETWGAAVEKARAAAGGAA